MGWESRQRGSRYYTRSRKVGGRVLREYVGGGLIGELASRHDAGERAERAANAAKLRAERARFAEAEAPLIELCEASDLLVRAVLLAAGYHQHHRGDWRKTRDQERDAG